MPNWCSNTTTIQGSQETLEWLMSVEFSFEKIRPMPDNQGLDWYDWNIEHWGTKWDVQDVESDLDLATQTLTLHYRTAWSPPIKLLQYLSEQRQLHITNYHVDEGYGFVGQTVIVNGNEVSDEYLEPHAHDTDSLQQYAANHNWFNYEDWSQFIRMMEGNE